MSDPGSPNPEKSQLGRAAGIVSVFTLLSRVLGLVRDMIIARRFGSGMVTDAFFVAFRIPNLLRRLFAEGSLSIAFIPVFTEYLLRKSREDALELARVVLTVLSLVLAIVTVAGVVASPLIVRLQAWGFGAAGDKYELTVLLTRITFPYIFFISIVALFMGILNSLRHFAAPAAAPIFLNVGMIGAAIWLSPRLSEPVVGLAIGVIIGGIIQVILQVPWLVKNGVSLRPLWSPRHPALSRIGLLMLPTIFGSAAYQLNQFIGTLLASFLQQGSVSWLYYADRIVQLPLGTFAIAIGTAALPSLARQASEDAQRLFRETLEYALRLVFFISIPSMVGLMVMGSLIVRVIFEGGDFSAVSTYMTTQALVFYCAGLWAFSGIRVVVAGFYALQDTKTPVYIAFMALLINTGCSLILMGPLKHGGLALSLSIASSVHFLLLGFLLYRRINSLNDFGPLLRSLGITILSSLLMGMTVLALYRFWWDPGPETGKGELIAGLGLLVFAGVLVYSILCRILGSSEVASVFRLLSGMLPKKP